MVTVLRGAFFPSLCLQVFVYTFSVALNMSYPTLRANGLCKVQVFAQTGLCIADV